MEKFFGGLPLFFKKRGQGFYENLRKQIEFFLVLILLEITRFFKFCSKYGQNLDMTRFIVDFNGGKLLNEKSSSVKIK